MYLGPDSLERFSEFIRAVPQTAQEVILEPEQVSVEEQPKFVSELKAIGDLIVVEEQPKVVEEQPKVVEEAKQDMENVPLPVPTSDNVPTFELPTSTESSVVIPDTTQVVPLEAPAPAQTGSDASWGSWLYSWVASETPATTQEQV
jgi:hypothetical protein